jgi:hypothetical protein
MDRRVNVDRRNVLVGIAVGVPMLVFGGTASTTELASCVNLDALSSSQRSLRKSLGFQLVSDDPKRLCVQCAFYKPGAVGGCGACTMFSGGPVTAKGRCNSWSPRG